MNLKNIAVSPVTIAKEFQDFLRGVEVPGVMEFSYTENGLKISASVTHPHCRSTVVLTMERDISASEWEILKK